MQKEIKIGTVSWIAADQSPIWFSGKAAVLEPDWIPKTYLGLAATSNSAPPKSIDFKTYQGQKDFRAMTFCHIKVDVNETTGAINQFQVVDALHDPGWTPPFRVRKFPATGLRFWDGSIWSFSSYAGEASPVSLVNTQARHANSTLTIPAGETVLVDALIKFRAGTHTDDIGIKKVGAPFHVPWVWCEMALTYVPGKFKFYGRGSIFPSHAWYVNDQQVKTVAEVGDSSFPTAVVCVPLVNPMQAPFIPIPTICIPKPLTINISALNLYKVLNKGAPASGSQTALSADKGRTGKIETHPNTVEGGTSVSGDF